MKHSNVFYRRMNDGCKPVENAKIVRNNLGFDLYRDGYNLCEGKTGLRIAAHKTKEEMNTTLIRLETDPDFKDKLDAAISQTIEKYGLTPRYERPDEKYDDLFPPKPKDKTVLVPTFYGDKTYFVEVYNENNIVLYNRKSEKGDPNAMLYLFYEGWMLGMDNSYHMDRILEELSNGIPDYKQEMTDSLEQALADPDKWVNPYYAKFLGRLDEALAHNQPIREKRQAEREAEQREWERKDEEQRQQEQSDYKAAIFDAEQALLSKKPIINDEIRGTSLILCLFRENGIDVPLKTQGWIKSSLHSVYYGENFHGWSFRYFGNTSNSFNGCFKRLADAIERKYDNILDQAANDLSEDDEIEP